MPKLEVRMKPEGWERLDVAAKAAGLSRSEFVRQAVEEALNQAPPLNASTADIDGVLNQRVAGEWVPMAKLHEPERTPDRRSCPRGCMRHVNFAACRVCGSEMEPDY